MKEYDYFNGMGWEKVNESFLENVKLENLKDVYKEGSCIRCVYKNGDEIFYENIYGTWGHPTKLV